MASYVITARNISQEPLVAVQIADIQQETPFIPDTDVVNAVRNLLTGMPGVVSVVAQKYEQVITVI